MNPEPHPVSSPSKAVDVLLRLDVLIHTLPLLVADANKAGGNLSATRTVAELREARDAIVELIAADKEYDAALLDLVAQPADDKDLRRFNAANERRRAALSTIGESHHGN